MAAKQTQLTQRQPHQPRSVMLTRFKLSQQKRQLREKERKTSHNESKSPQIQKSPEAKKLKGKGTPSKSKKAREEFHLNKLKRKIATKKVVLKSRHEMKVIGGGGNCKRKLNMPQKGTKSSPAKRVKIGHNFKSGLSEADRSQSPVYSELGFEEVIRMADENHSLDDDDLLEILTCPSPVWWEDPPDERYMEGPIIMSSPKTTSLSTLSKQFRSKAPRKKTPHKLILEHTDSSNNNQGDKQNGDKIIDNDMFKNINKTDDKFRNKRSKLESLLSIIKNKLDEPQCQNNNINKKEEIIKENCTDKNDFVESKPTHNKTVPNRSKKESESELDDLSFADISQQDKDSLKHLENIEIPIEGKSKNSAEKTDINTESKTSVDFGNISINPNETLRAFRKSKNFLNLVPNKKLKILNIKKMITNPLNLKKNTQMKIYSAKSLLKDQNNSTEKLQCNKQFKIINQNDLKSETKKSLYNNKEDKANSTKIPSKENPKTEDYITVFKIVSNITDKEEIQTKHTLEEDAEEMNSENELTDKESKTLDSYYKKCKGGKRDMNKINTKDKTEVKINREIAEGDQKKEESIDEKETLKLCDSCDNDPKVSIIVPTTTDVKYCLKCSSIFDLDECDYCIRKEKGKQKVLEHSTESKSDESLDFISLSNRDKVQQNRNDLGDKYFM